MRRRSVIASAAAAAASLAAPRIASAQRGKVLRFVPQADLALLDPVQTTGLVTRNHGLMIFDTLYGVDENYVAQPQMVEGHVVSQDGRQWEMRLRDGLRFHDGTPVLARDCVASLQRWAKRDSFGLALMAATDEISAPDDRTIRFRLKRPFPLLPDALGKAGANIAPMMPERLACLDAMHPVPEMVGSGPYRFVAEERVMGSLAVYARFADYVPRSSGLPSFLAGPRIAYFDRVEWRTIPDASTAAAALQTGEVDWWEQPTTDVLPLLARNRNIKVELLDKTGAYSFLRPNHLQPPFDNPGVRRALMGAINQADFMQAVVGADRSLWRDNVGFFLPDSPMASGAGMEALSGPRDLKQAKRDLGVAGYKGERVVMLVPTDFPGPNAMSEVAGDMLRRIGINLDYQALDWGTVLQRLVSHEPVERGGWSLFCAWTMGIGTMTPAAHNFLRGSGQTATFGWPSSPRLEQLRDAWFAAPDQDAQRSICRDIQTQAFLDVPYYPTGIYYQPTAYRANFANMQKGAPLFTGIRPG